MPFTLSHPVFAAPFRHLKLKNRNMFSTTGLVLGSMSPDFEYFLMLEPYRSIGHSWAGLFFQAIPLSFLLAVLFHYTVKVPFSLHLPSVLHIDKRMYQFLYRHEFGTIRSWIVFICSVVTGFFTHIFADGFTHGSGFFVSNIPMLRELVVAGLPLYKFLQYFFSVIGLAVLSGLLMYELSKSSAAIAIPWNISKKQKVVFWFRGAAISVIVTAVKLILADSQNIIGILVVAPISGAVLGITVSSLIWQIRNRKTGNRVKDQVLKSNEMKQ